MNNKKLSVKDIAKMADVSIATVSRVLNKNGRYSPETERRILDIVKKYDYTPNVNAKSLRTNISQCIGIITPDITNEFFAKIVRSIENHILPYNYSVFICDSHENEQMERRHLSNLAAKNVDGVISISGISDVSGLTFDSQIPIVYIDRTPDHALAIVHSDNEYGGYLATEELIKKGCRRIAILRDFRSLATIRQRYSGYQKAHEKYGVSLYPELDMDGAADYMQAKQRITELIESDMDFDGVFATNDIMALGALHALSEHQIQVPGKVKLVGFDDISLSEFCEPPITTITQDTDKIGQKAIQILMQLMQGKNLELNDFIVPVSLNIRRTT